MRFDFTVFNHGGKDKVSLSCMGGDNVSVLIIRSPCMTCEVCDCREDLKEGSAGLPNVIECRHGCSNGCGGG